MSACHYCGAEVGGDPTRIPCPSCGQKVPVKSMIHAGLQSSHHGPMQTMSVAAQPRPLPASPPRSTVQHAVGRTPAQIKQEFHQRLAAKQGPKLFSPLRFLAALMFSPVWLVAIYPIAKSYNDPMGELPKFGLMGGIIPGVTALVFSRIAGRGVVRSLMATIVYAITAMLVMAKPYVAPMKWQFEGNQYVFSPTSETHLHFLIPGFILCFLTLVRFKTILTDFAAMFRKET